MKPDQLFQFVDHDQATSFQRRMAPKVVSIDDPRFAARRVCGMDAAYAGETGFAAATVWDIGRHCCIEKVSSTGEVTVQYLPGLLGFREGPILLQTSRKLHSIPDVYLIDGQGVAHPRRFGLACQFGLAVDRPTIGVAKSLLYGKPVNDSIVDSDGRVIGRIIISLRGKKFYVSVGHRISLDTAARLVKDCFVDGHPAPIREAHLESERLKRSRGV